MGIWQKILQEIVEYAQRLLVEAQKQETEEQNDKEYHWQVALAQHQHPLS